MEFSTSSAHPSLKFPRKLKQEVTAYVHVPLASYMFKWYAAYCISILPHVADIMSHCEGEEHLLRILFMPELVGS